MCDSRTLLWELFNYAREQYFPQEEFYRNLAMEAMQKSFYRQDGYVKILKTAAVVTHMMPGELQKTVEYACEQFNSSKLYTLSEQMI